MSILHQPGRQMVSRIFSPPTLYYMQNGQIVWIKNHGIPLKSKIKIFDEKMFLINQDNRILCFSAKDGTKIWDTRAIKSFIKSQHLLSLAISKDGYLLSLDSSGNLLKSEIAKGNKCARCYRILPEVGTISGYEMACGRCADAVDQFQKLSE